MSRIDIHDKEEECLHPPGAGVHRKNWPDGQERGPLQIIHYTQI